MENRRLQMERCGGQKVTDGWGGLANIRILECGTTRMLQLERCGEQNIINGNDVEN